MSHGSLPNGITSFEVLVMTAVCLPRQDVIPVYVSTKSNWQTLIVWLADDWASIVIIYLSTYHVPQYIFECVLFIGGSDVVDLFRPQFQFSVYSRVVSEDTPVSSDIGLTVEAFDTDLQGELIYRVVGDDQAPLFFKLNANNQVIVKRPLTQAPDNIYLVSRTLSVVRNLMTGQY